VAANSQRVSERLYNLLAVGEGSQCPLRVISRHSRASALSPLYPNNRTWTDATGMSALCHEQTSRRSQAGLRLTSCQFAFTPVALTKAAFMLISDLTCASSSAGARTSGSTPIVASFSCTLGVCMAFNVSR
jgi:hypothetical protein